jgi:hypothetical protein
MLPVMSRQPARRFGAALGGGAHRASANAPATHYSSSDGRHAILAGGQQESRACNTLQLVDRLRSFIASRTPLLASGLRPENDCPTTRRCPPAKR